MLANAPAPTPAPVPALVAAGVDSGGLPLGLQVIGKALDEATVFQVADVLEQEGNKEVAQILRAKGAELLRSTPEGRVKAREIDTVYRKNRRHEIAATALLHL